MMNARLVAFLGLLALATIFIGADAVFTSSDSIVTGLMAPDASLLLFPIAAIIAYAAAANRAPDPVRRRRVNRARLRARRAAP